MALEVLHNHAATHENEQFRRVVQIMDAAFEKHNYNGILIGNPYNERYRRFRTDAILLYDKGVVLIDFKDYSGQIILPRGEEEFLNYAWYVENSDDHQAIEIKGGAHFINPFKQLASYRTAFREIIESNTILKNKINSSRVCIANIFSGPLKLNTKVPGKFRYYKMVQESELGQFLYDLNSENVYDEEAVNFLKTLFPAEEYIRDYSPKVEIVKKQEIIVEDSAKSAIDEFIKADGNDILVLASMDSCERDNWAKYLYSIADENSIPEVESLCHSTRIGRRLQARGVEAASMYSTIYGGTKELESHQDADDGDESSMQIIPIKSDSGYDDHALIIVQEAHLISRSLSQSELLRFGSGRLLEDFLSFMNPDSCRKIVFLGDPFMLTYGSAEDSAMNVGTLKEICGDRIIHYYVQPVPEDFSTDKTELRNCLAKSMEAQLFNNLRYGYSDGSIVEASHNDIIMLMRDWFSKPFCDEPNCAIFFYKKADCAKTNLWIKSSCLQNGHSIAQGDLLIANNNIYIPDETGFGNPRRILNGMYFTVNYIKDHYSATFPVKGASESITLSFTKISVKCLSLNKQDADVWILDNYLLSEEDLSKEEQIAMRIFINERLSSLEKKSSFKDSSFYKHLLNDDAYKNLNEIDKNILDIRIENRTVAKEKRQKVTTTAENRRLLKKYYDRYKNELQQNLRENDALVNALYVKYGWAITVHKGIGSAFENVILKGNRGENLGNNNEGYFRWLYSGVTSSVGTFYITQPQTLNPFMKCNIHEFSSVANSASKTILVYEGYEVESRYKDLVSGCRANTAAAICEFTKCLESSGCLLEKVEKSGEYLSKAFYSIPQSTSQKLIVDFNNKGAKDSWGVSAIRMEPLACFDRTIVDTAVALVFDNVTDSSASMECPEYIKTVYSALSDFMRDNGISTKRLVSKDYQDVFLFKSLSGEAKVRFWYGTSIQNHSKGYINKIEVFESNDASIIEVIKSYVSELQ